MDELDILKKHWRENQKFPKLSQDEIRSMIHKKSSSIVMWIFIISIIEFVILNAIGYFVPNDKRLIEPDIPLVDEFLDKFEYLSIITSLIFVFIFYKNYRKIKAYSSSKELMRQIINTKKTVNYYIYLNIAFIITSLCFIFISICYHDSTVLSDNSNVLIILFSIFILITLIFIGVVWLFYKLIYGLLLKKLTNNLKELEKIIED